MGNPTLNRFFSLHYLLPFLVTGRILVHLVLLHITGSSNPTTSGETPSKIAFGRYFIVKDAFILIAAYSVFFFVGRLRPDHFGHADNFLEANPRRTPPHIVPE